MKFNSATLQSSFEQSKPILDNIHQIKDSVSEDIKQLETYLRSLDLNETIVYRLAEHIFTHLADELLVWDHNKKRIVYIEDRYKVNDDCHYHTADISSRETIVERPLIETPFDIRKRIYEEDHLSKFILFISKKYDLKKPMECPF